jgi:hypothetical protein
LSLHWFGPAIIIHSQREEEERTRPLFLENLESSFRIKLRATNELIELKSKVSNE